MYESTDYLTPHTMERKLRIERMTCGIVYHRLSFCIEHLTLRILAISGHLIMLCLSVQKCPRRRIP